MKRPFRIISVLVAVIAFAFASYSLAGDPSAPLVVKGKVVLQDGSPLAEKVIVAAKVDSQGREIIVMKGDQPLPPPATTTTDSKGNFTLSVDKNKFGGMTIRFCLKAVGVFQKGDSIHIRDDKGKPYIVDVDLFTDSVNLADKVLVVAKR